MRRATRALAGVPLLQPVLPAVSGVRETGAVAIACEELAAATLGCLAGAVKTKSCWRREVCLDTRARAGHGGAPSVAECFPRMSSGAYLESWRSAAGGAEVMPRRKVVGNREPLDDATTSAGLCSGGLVYSPPPAYASIYCAAPNRSTATVACLLTRQRCCDERGGPPRRCPAAEPRPARMSRWATTALSD
jgi:hypothetical protein